MRHRAFAVVGFVLCAALGVPDIAAAQNVAPPAIHRVIVQPDSGVLMITGTGLGPDLFVSVDGHSVAVLPGATDTQMEVLAPAAVLTTPGSYRLTVVDPARQVRESFVVASHAGSVASAGAILTGSPSGPSDAMTGRAPATGLAATAGPPTVGGPPPQAVIEDTASPFRTAIGHLALSSNNSTSGWHNTASGYRALDANTTGHRNTATGSLALVTNTTGYWNTASGYEALLANSTGPGNTATGAFALLSNTTGSDNTATGKYALTSNTTAFYNTASGAYALYANTTGANNTASGYAALYSNSTTGANNTATGYAALYSNTSGQSNTASGLNALYSNTTGQGNAAVGSRAGFSATTGSYNLFLGADVIGTAADTNTIRIGLPYSGGVGQNQTFIAGIHGTQLTGPAVPVFVDANGQLGTLTPPIATGTGTTPPAPLALQQQVQAQQAINAELRQRSQEQQATIEDLLARLARLEAAARGSRRQ